MVMVPLMVGVGVGGHALGCTHGCSRVWVTPAACIWTKPQFRLADSGWAPKASGVAYDGVLLLAAAICV